MIDELITRAAAEDDDAVEELSTLADAEPGRLTPYQSRMLDLDVLWPPNLYRGADAAVVARVVEQVDGGQPLVRLNHLLLVLAHSGHPLAEDALRRWAVRPPAGAEQLHIGPLDYSREAGWTVGPDGARRELCGDAAFRWDIRETPRRDDPGRCPWCTSPLWTAADLDTADAAVGAALAHTGWSGRLTVRTCHFCACYATLFSHVTADGASTWWAGNTHPDYLPKGIGPEDPPALLPAVGAALPSPFRANAWEQGGSTLGGRPDWIQDAAHPDCPGCGQPMDYVGLVRGGDLDEYGEGAYYLHLHQPCGLAAVNYQQS